MPLQTPQSMSCTADKALIPAGFCQSRVCFVSTQRSALTGAQCMYQTATACTCSSSINACDCSQGRADSQSLLSLAPLNHGSLYLFIKPENHSCGGRPALLIAPIIGLACHSTVISTTRACKDLKMSQGCSEVCGQRNKRSIPNQGKV